MCVFLAQKDRVRHQSAPKGVHAAVVGSWCGGDPASSKCAEPEASALTWRGSPGGGRRPPSGR